MLRRNRSIRRLFSATFSRGEPRLAKLGPPLIFFSRSQIRSGSQNSATRIRDHRIGPNNKAHCLSYSFLHLQAKPLSTVDSQSPTWELTEKVPISFHLYHQPPPSTAALDDDSDRIPAHFDRKKEKRNPPRAKATFLVNRWRAPKSSWGFKDGMPRLYYPLSSCWTGNILCWKRISLDWWTHHH